MSVELCRDVGFEIFVWQRLCFGLKAFGGGRHEMGRIDRSWQPIFAVDLNYRHQIEPQQRKVGQVVLRQTLAEQMRVHAAKPAKTVFGHAGTPKIRHLDLFCGADHDVFDLALTINEDADLPAGLVRDLGHLPG